MEHTGHVRIERKIVPYHLKDKKVNLIPNNTYASLLPGDVKENEVIKELLRGTERLRLLDVNIIIVAWDTKHW